MDDDKEKYEQEGEETPGQLRHRSPPDSPTTSSSPHHIEDIFENAQQRKVKRPLDSLDSPTASSLTHHMG